MICAWRVRWYVQQHAAHTACPDVVTALTSTVLHTLLGLGLGLEFTLTYPTLTKVCMRLANMLWAGPAAHVATCARPTPTRSRPATTAAACSHARAPPRSAPRPAGLPSARSCSRTAATAVRSRALGSVQSMHVSALGPVGGWNLRLACHVLQAETLGIGLIQGSQCTSAVGLTFSSTATVTCTARKVLHFMHAHVDCLQPWSGACNGQAPADSQGLASSSVKR